MEQCDFDTPIVAAYFFKMREEKSANPEVSRGFSASLTTSGLPSFGASRSLVGPLQAPVGDLVEMSWGLRVLGSLARGESLHRDPLCQEVGTTTRSSGWSEKGRLHLPGLSDGTCQDRLVHSDAASRQHVLSASVLISG